MRRLTVVAGFVLLAAACGGIDSSNDGDSDAICELALAQALLGDGADTMAADLDPFIDVAPGSLRSDLVKVRSLFAELEEIESTEGDEAAFAAALELSRDIGLTVALSNIERYFVDECGLAPTDG